MIRETIVTTLSPDGVAHVAPMGATPIEEGWLLQPFRPSTTLDNFLATRCGVVNFTDDARIFAGCVTKRRPAWPTAPASEIPSVRLQAALSHHEVRVARIDGDGERPKLHCVVVAERIHRAFLGLNRAVALLAEKRAGGAGRRAEAQALKELGNHPVDGQPVRVLSGRYGPYIKHGSTNANVPRGSDPQALTLDEAVKLIAEREAKGGGTKKKPARAAKAKADAAPKKTAAKKTPAKKPAAKKTAKKAEEA